MYLEPDCLANLYKTLRENKGFKWAFGKFHIDGRAFNDNKGRVPQNKKSISYAMYFHGISTMSLIDASCDPVFDENLKRYVDWDLWMTLDKQGHKGIFCDNFLFTTYNRQNGISNPDKNETREKMEILFKKHGINPKEKLADIIIPHQDRHDHLKNCLDQLDYRKFNIIIVTGGTFSENCNKGSRIAETDNLIFLNDDTLPDNDVLMEMIESEADFVGVAQYVPVDKKIYYGIGYKKQGSTLTAGLMTKREDVSIPSGYCFLVRKKMWQEMNGLDEEYINGGEDQDFGFRAIKEGYSIDYIDRPMTHLHSQSKDRFIKSKHNQALLAKMWPDKKLVKLLNL